MSNLSIIVFIYYTSVWAIGRWRRYWEDGEGGVENCDDDDDDDDDFNNNDNATKNNTF